MRSPIVQTILDSTPFWVKLKIVESELNYLTNVSNSVPLSFMYDVNEARGWYRD